MNGAAWSCFWAWSFTLSRRQRMVLHAFWVVQLVAVLAVLLAPHAFAAGLDAVVGFTGVHDSYGVPLVTNSFVNGDDSLFDWNGVLPRIHAGTSISTGIVNAIGEAETAFIVVTVALFLWLIRALRSVFWNHLIGSIFSSVGLSLNALLDSTPVLYTGILVGTFGGVLAMGVGRYTAGRMMIGTTWALGIVGVSLGRNVLASMLAPAGWIDKIRVISEGAAGVMMRQSHTIGAGVSPLDNQSNRLETGFADATRQALQDWMLGRVVDPRIAATGAARPGTDGACSQAWTLGQKSGNPTTLAQHLAGSPSDGIAPACPTDVLMHIQHVNLFNGMFIWLLLLGCLGVGAWFAWCGLNCRFRFVAHGAFAVGYLVYGLFPTFPRRFLKLVSADIVVQGLSDGLYTILTGLYVMVLLAAWTVAGHIPLIGELAINRLVITAITMVLLTGYVSHVRKIHRMATQLPVAGNVSASKLAAPATMAAAAGLSAGVASRGGRFAASGGGRGGGGGGVNNKATSARINAGLQAAQTALSRLHPATAAAGAIAGGFGSAAMSAHGQKKAEAAEKKESGGKTPSSVTPPAPGGRGPAGPAGAAPAAGGQRSPDHVQKARQRASTARSDASSVAAQTALKRPGGRSAPVRGGSSGFIQ
jgi:hypothetical protein